VNEQYWPAAEYPRHEWCFGRVTSESRAVVQRNARGGTVWLQILQTIFTFAT
jgi:hypothetical protein